MNKDNKISILIIDDNPGDQILLHENLLLTSLLIDEIIMADTLEEGKSYMSSKNISLVFLDLFLPDSEGLKSLSDMVKLNSGLTVIIYSGLGDTNIAVEAITRGAQDYLIKGEFTVGLLEKTIRYSMERKINLDALEKSNERYTFLSKATHDMVWDWDLETGVVFRNPEGWKKLFGSQESIETGTQDDWPLKVHPDDRVRVAELINSAIESYDQEMFQAEFRILRDDGTYGYIRDRAYILRDQNQKAIRLIGASHDITEMKIVEEEVRLSSERFQSLVQNSADLLAILDPQGTYTFVSPSSKHILGYEADFFIGKSAFEFIHPEDIPTTLKAFETVFSAKSLKTPLFRFKNSSGEWRWIESSVTNMIDNPSVGGIVVNSRDVTERKVADDEIERLSLVAKNTLSGVFILNPERRIQWVNDAFTTITEFTFDEAIGMKPQDLLYGKDPDTTVFNTLRDKLSKGITYEGERLQYTKSGKPIWVWLQLQTIYNQAGEVKQYFAVLSNITKQKELEEKVELEKRIKQNQITDAVYTAQEKERSEIGRELHDNVNQLLGATRLYIDMAIREKDNCESLLINATELTLTAIEEIRKLSKTLITPLIKENGLGDSINDLAAEIMLVHPIDISVDVHGISDDNWDDKFTLNLFRIVQEQLNNVLKHAQASQVCIEIKECDDNVFISIRDNGVGFDPSKRKAGVGLTNIRSRSELSKGEMQLNSTPGIGTSLSIKFKKAYLLEQTMAEC